MAADLPRPDSDNPVERARALTGTDGRGLYQALIEKTVTFYKGFAPGVSHQEYLAHLPTSLLVEETRGWPVVWNLAFDLERYDDVGGFWDYPKLREVWTYSNTYPTAKKLRVSKGPTAYSVISADWLDA